MKTPAVPLKLRLITATLEPQQVLCPYAAVTGRFYLRLRFLPSGSGATARGLFPRLAPTAVSLKADTRCPLLQGLYRKFTLFPLSCQQKIMYVFCFPVKKVRLSGKKSMSSGPFCLLSMAFPEKKHSFIRIASCFCHVFRLTLSPSFPILFHVFHYGINGSIGG